MEKEYVGKKSSRGCLKGCLVAIVSLFTFGGICLVFLMVTFDSGGVDVREDQWREDQMRHNASVKLKNTIERYYHTYKVFPDSKVIYAVDDDQIRAYLKSHVIRYRRDPTGKKWFVLKYIESDERGWSGKQYSNKPEVLNLPSGAKPYKNGFYILDLH